MKYLLFGTGDYYGRYKKWFSREDVPALLDNSPEKQNTYIDGIMVLPPEQGIRLEYDIIVILSFYVREMKRQLRALGVPEEKICHFYELHDLLDGKAMQKPVIYFGEYRKFMHAAGRKILLLSQDLELGGPALALLHAARALKNRGFLPVAASMADGQLRGRLSEEGIPVIVDVNLQICTMAEAEWIKDFDLIICNTINFHVFLSERSSSTPVIWWLHDSEFFYHGIKREALEAIDMTNVTVCSVGPVPKRAIQSCLPDLPVRNLLYAVRDTGSVREAGKRSGKELCFVTIGYIENRKGQDILMRAIALLTEDVRQRSKFYFVGQDTSLLAQEVKKQAARIPEIVITGKMNRNEIDDMLGFADVLICPSREDPMPTVCAEAMMHGVPCIVSDAVGMAEYIRDCENGLIFERENEKMLSQKVSWCMENYRKLPDMGKRARKVYEDNFREQVFEQELFHIVNASIDEGVRR